MWFVDCSCIHTYEHTYGMYLHTSNPLCTHTLHVCMQTIHTHTHVQTMYTQHSNMHTTHPTTHTPHTTHSTHHTTQPHTPHHTTPHNPTHTSYTTHNTPGMSTVVSNSKDGQYGTSYKIVPETTQNFTNQITCFKIPGMEGGPVMPQGVLPDVTNFTVSTLCRSLY